MKDHGPCPRCGGNDWRMEQRGEYRVRRCRTCVARHQRDRRKRLPHITMYAGAHRRSRETGSVCTLKPSDVAHIISDWTCVYCETPVGSFTGGTRPNSATLDRIDPADGYTPQNTVLACHRCNAAKAEHTPTSLRQWADRIEAVINRKHPKEEA